MANSPKPQGGSNQQQPQASQQPQPKAQAAPADPKATAAPQMIRLGKDLTGTTLIPKPQDNS